MKVNKLKKGLIAIITIIITILFIPNVYAITETEYTNKTTGYKVIIEDDANLLKQNEINKLKEEIIPLTQYGNVIFKTISTNDTTARNYAENYYHVKFNEESGSLLLIDMDTREIYVFSEGKNYKVVTNQKALIITDNIYQYASNEQYYDCASKGFSQINTLLEGGKITAPMKHISNILISITIAFYISFIIVIVKTEITQPKLIEKICNYNIKFNVSNIVVTKTGTHKKYSPQSSSGGSSSGGGGGGGSSSGGGGGHRF